MGAMDMDTGVDTTMERGLLKLRLMLMPGTDTTDMPTDPMAMDTMDTDLMAMDTTTERGLLMRRLLLLLMPMLPLRLMPGTDTTDMPTGLMPMDTTDTTGPMAIMAMERSKKHNFYQTAAN